MKAEWDAVSLTQAFIRQESPSGSEGAVAMVTKTAMRDLGFRDVECDEVGNVLGFAGPEGTGTALLFDAHMDVVPATGTWSVPAFGGELIDGRVYGRGAADMKGALAAAIVGVGQAARSGSLLRQVAVSASVLEETVEGAALAFVLDRAAPDAVVICEPSSLTIKHGQRGRLEILIEIAGIPAHAAHPERGKNPLMLAADALKALDAMPLSHDVHLGPAIIVPTDIVTTPYPSISSIPPLATIRCDRRTVTGETAETVLAELRRVLALIDPDAFTVTVAREPVQTYTGRMLEVERDLSAWLADPDAPLARAAAASLAEAGRPVRYGVYAFCTNGSESAGRRRIPTIGLGPGAEADAHTVDESVDASELVDAAVVYRDLAIRLAGGRA